MSTRSPVLRRKIASLVPDSAADPELDDLLDELHRRTQVLLLRESGDQKIKTLLRRAKVQIVHAPGLLLSQKGSSVPNVSTTDYLTDHTGSDLVNENLHLQDGGQSHENMSHLPAHGLTHLESTSSYGFATYGASSTRGDRNNFASQEDHMNNDMEDAGWDDDDMVSYSSEDLLECGGLYSEHAVQDEVLDLTSSEHEYQEQHHAPGCHQESGTVDVDYYDESDLYGSDYEVPDIEGEVPAKACAFGNYSAQPNNASGTCEDSAGADYSDVAASEDNFLSDNIYVCLGDNGPDFGDGKNDLRDTYNDYDEGDMLCWGDMDTEAGPNYITGSHAHDDEAEGGQGNTWVGSDRYVLQDWGQVPRSYAYHDTEDQWARAGPHPNAFTSRLAGHQ